jgi:hypothetical protein
MPERRFHSLFFFFLEKGKKEKKKGKRNEKLKMMEKLKVAIEEPEAKDLTKRNEKDL